MGAILGAINGELSARPRLAIIAATLSRCPMPLDGFTIRRVLLEICDEYHPKGVGFFQSRVVLREAERRLSIRTVADQQALLTAFGDLFRQGVLGWGYDIGNAHPPFMHLTEIGRRALASLSRDPYNPAGYLAVVRPLLAAYPVALSYIEEASKTFLTDCIKASAVMVGGAAEALVLSTRDVLVARLSARRLCPVKAEGLEGQDSA